MDKTEGSKYPFNKLNNVIITPHLSANTDNMILGRWNFINDNLKRFINSENLISTVNFGT